MLVPYPEYLRTFTDDQRVRFDEIAAFIEFEHGRPRGIAEQLAIIALRNELKQEEKRFNEKTGM